MAMFLPNPDVVDQHPLQEDPLKPSRGLMIQAEGAPQLGFQQQFLRNYNCTGDKSLESATQVGSMDAKYVPVPTDTTFVRESTSRGLVDKYALDINAPPAMANGAKAVSTCPRSCFRIQLLTV